MSGHGHARLAELDDPTNTAQIREGFLREVRRRFRRLRGQIREAVGYEDDVLHLADDARLADADDVERFPTDAGKTRAFIKWLRGKLTDDILEPATRGEVEDGEHWSATYIRAAYSRGWENAMERLQEAGVSTAGIDRDIFDLGVPRRQLRRLYTRAYDNLKNIAEGDLQPIRETLTQGLADGWNPRKMADKLTDEVRSLQRARAEVLARTEVINSYADATLDRYDRAGQSGVTVSGEFATADDARVCPICESIEGAEFTTNEMRDETFEFDPSTDPDAVPSDAGTYPVKPPVHPQCRCAILPVIG
jgi:SPP1 gp7 family putative phage head morphogenesis protein